MQCAWILPTWHHRTLAVMTRPRVEICMISTIDGVVEVEGRSRPLGGPADQRHLLSLRAEVDLVLVGAGTARAEQYGPPSAPHLRIAVVTSSCELNFESPLFASGKGIVVTHLDAPQVPVESIRAGHRSIDLGEVLEQLHAQGVRRVLAEGGPQLNAALLAADLADVVHLTVSPQLMGSRGSSWVNGAHDSRRFQLSHHELREGFVFTRWERARRAT